MTDKWAQRERGLLFSRREEEQTEWVLEVTDKWGAKRKRMLFGRGE